MRRMSRRRQGVILALAAAGAFGLYLLLGRDQTGLASYYGDQFQGRVTANGERFDKRAMTAAHRTFPFGTRVRVTNLENGREVVVRINDRGPFVAGRIIDLSEAAAEKLGMIAAGVVRVRVEREGTLAAGE